MAEHKPGLQEGSAPSPAGGSGAKVLLVDDRPENLLAHQQLLADLGAELVLARSGQEALGELLRGGGFAVIILDVKMPDLDGYETARMIRGRAATRGIPIILVTGFDLSAAEISKAYALGVVDCLSKPVHADAFRSKVAFFIDLYEQTRLAQIFQGALDAVVVMDSRGLIRDWNPQAEAVFGWSREEAIGRPMAETLIPLRYRARHEGGMEHFRKTGEGPILGKRMELEALRRDGSEFPIELAVTLLRFPGELRFCAFIRDVTERRRAEEAVRTLHADLERRVRERTRSFQEAARELETFAYTVAHDLRAPLRAMQGFSEILLEDHAGKLGDPGVDLARRIVQSGQRMDRLIQDLLSYSRLSRDEVQIGEVPLASVVEDVLRDLKGDLDLRRARVDVEGPLPRVLGHEMTLRQALANLVSNAVKFVGPGVEPRVRIRAQARGAAARLWIEDNGIGMAAEHLGRLFRPFVRLHLEEQYPGTGIGLAIVRRALERMGGEAGVESELGKGSRFWIQLPWAPAAETGGRA